MTFQQNMKILDNLFTSLVWNPISKSTQVSNVLVGVLHHHHQYPHHHRIEYFLFLIIENRKSFNSVWPNWAPKPAPVLGMTAGKPNLVVS